MKKKLVAAAVLAYGMTAQAEVSNLTADPTTDSIQLDWNDSNTKFRVSYTSNPAGPRTRCRSGNGAIRVTVQNATSYTIGNLAEDTNYYIRVCERIGRKWSTGVTVTSRTLADVPPPPPPPPANDDSELAASGTSLPSSSDVGAYDEGLAKTAVSLNGDRMTIWPKDEHAGLQYCRNSDCGDLTSSGRFIYDSPSGNRSYHVGAGANGNFVVCWVDASGGDSTSTSSDAKLRAKRYINGAWESTKTLLTYANKGGTVTHSPFRSVSCDMAPNGDAVVATSNPDQTFNSTPRMSKITLLMYHKFADAQAADNFSLIADEYVLHPTQKPIASSIITNAVKMDAVGNIMTVFTAGEKVDNLGANEELFYAVWRATSESWSTPASLVTNLTDGLMGSQAIYLAVDRQRNLTSTSGTDRGRAAYAIAVGTNSDIYGGTFYNGSWKTKNVLLSDDGAGDDTLHGIGLSESEGHVVVAYQDEEGDAVTSNNVDDVLMVHYWFSDSNNDGVLDGAHGWKNTNGYGVLVNDATVSGAPSNWDTANSVNSSSPSVNQVALGSNNGLIVWGDGAGGLEDTVHVRRIVGFNAADQSVALEGDGSAVGGSAISQTQHHTLADGIQDQFARYPSVFVNENDEGAATYVNTSKKVEVRPFN